MFPEPDTSVVVEYSCRGRRVQKFFTCMYQARQFYVAKFKAGKSPKVLKPEAQSGTSSQHR
jgi:hypothetical protein